MDEARPTTTLRRWEPFAAAAVVVVPVLVNGVRAWSQGWVPTWDTAFIQLRVLDVGTGRTPLVGMPSTISAATGQLAAHPGPLAFWLLAPLLRALSWTPSALALAASLLNAAWLGLAVALVAALRSRAALWGAAAALGLLVWFLGEEVPHDPWNPHLAVLAWALAITAATVAVHGCNRALPLAALGASFAAQAHLAFSLPAVAVGALAAGAVVRRAARRDRSARTALVVTVVVSAAAWSGPLLDQVLHRPGNLRTLAGSGGAATALGWSRAVERAVLVLRPGGLVFRRRITAGELVGPVGLLAWLAAGALVAVFAAATWRSWRRRSPLGAMGLVAAVAAAATVLSTAVMPMGLASLFGLHVARVWWPPAVAIWAVVVAGAGSGASRRWVRPRWRSAIAPIAAAGAGLVALAGAATWNLTGQRDGEWFGPVHDVARLVPGDLRADPLVLRTEGVPFESQAGAGLLADLARRGFDVVADGVVTAGLLDSGRQARQPGLGTPRRELVLAVGVAGAPPAGSVELGRVAAVVGGGIDGVGGHETVILLLTLGPVPGRAEHAGPSGSIRRSGQAGEGLRGLGLAGDDEEIAGLEHGVGGRVRVAAAGGLDADHGHPVAGT